MELMHSGFPTLKSQVYLQAATMASSASRTGRCNLSPRRHSPDVVHRVERARAAWEQEDEAGRREILTYWNHVIKMWGWLSHTRRRKDRPSVRSPGRGLDVVAIPGLGSNGAHSSPQRVVQTSAHDLQQTTWPKTMKQSSKRAIELQIN